jgi:hypothetical protein
MTNLVFEMTDRSVQLDFISPHKRMDQATIEKNLFNATYRKSTAYTIHCSYCNKLTVL